jgi:hypothetical protein
VIRAVGKHTKLTEALMKVNDNRMTAAVREARIQKLFAKINVKVVFVGKGFPTCEDSDA